MVAQRAGENRVENQVTTDEVDGGKAKVGFIFRFINRDLVVGSLPDMLSDHNQATIEYFLTVRKGAVSYPTQSIVFNCGMT